MMMLVPAITMIGGLTILFGFSGVVLLSGVALFIISATTKIGWDLIRKNYPHYIDKKKLAIIFAIIAIFTYQVETRFIIAIIKYILSMR